ncbi:MAG TPA: hypothetical protein VG106_11810 [Vicinamibacterales bacterium]|nr:hypothetical protein [Vicinamibacterales bacterium]
MPAFTLVLAMAGFLATPSAEREESGSSSAARFLSSYEEPLTQYRAYRRMHARSERFNQEGWLEAWTELDANGFRFEVVNERGSEYVRNKVLKAVLKREQELIADGHAERASLSLRNYEFEDAAMSGDGLRYVLLKPKRKDVLLVDGRMVLSADGSELLRVEGRLTKNPSFWTSLVNVVRHYAKLDGVRVPVATESIAKVKFAGQSRMEVEYEYETINGRTVSAQARQILASR